MRIRFPRLAVGVSLLLAACSGGNGSGHSEPALEDVNHNGQIVLLAFGDSITRGVGDGPRPSDTPPGTAGYPMRLQKLLSVTVINDGSSGERTIDGLPRLRRDLAAIHPDYAILLEGTNDLLGGDSMSQAVDNMRSMINSVFAVGAVPILGTITPFCCDTENRHPRSATLSYNDQLRALAASESLMLIDFYRAFAGGPEAGYDASRGLIHVPEGVHPTPAGYDAMADAARRLFSAH